MKSPSISHDRVYHATPFENVDAILQEGLLAKPDSKGIELRQLVDEVADAGRPPEFIAAGISRKGAVYAHPAIGRVRRYSDGAASATSRGEKSAILEVAADPDIAIVADRRMIDKVSHALLAEQAGGKNDASQESIKWAVEAYWSTAITLREYRELYDQDSRRLIDTTTDRELPFYYDRPEVLIPTPVEPDGLVWAASILLRQEVETGHV